MNIQSEDHKFVYELDDKAGSTKDIFLYSLQWVLAMFYPVVWGYSIVGLNIGFDSPELAAFMGRVVLMIGLTTLLHALMGHRLSMLSGPNIISSVAVVAAFAVGGKEGAFLAFNASLLSGLLIALLGFFGVLTYLHYIWTPLVLGSMIMMVGLVTSVIGMGLIVSCGLSWQMAVGIFLALFCGFLSLCGRGIVATIPVLITIIIGYIIFIIFGHFDWQVVEYMPVFSLPQIFAYGWEMPPWSMLVTMFFVNLFAVVKMYGNVNAYADFLKYKHSRRQEKRYFTLFGLIDVSLCSAFGVPSYVPYAENIGLVLLTKVAARIFIILAGFCFIVLSFLGKFAGMIAAMPKELAGAILLGVASTLIAMGAKIWQEAPTQGPREIFITGFSVFFCFGLSKLPEEFYAESPGFLSMLLQNPIVTVIITTVLLEQVVFRFAGKKS